jgi:hypothetical protein
MSDEVSTLAMSVSPWRLWATGQAPNGVVLPPIVGQDTPTPPATAWGKLCTVKACRKRDPQATKSLRFQPSGLCVACWQRWDKRVTSDEEGPSA